MSTQTLSVGQIPQQKYTARLGGYFGKATRPANAITALLIGLPGEGKSSFLQTCKDAFILDFDLSGTTTPNPQAVMWPGISPAGQPMNDDGNEFVPRYEDFREKVDILLEMATEQDPNRPKIVVFDTLSKWKEYVEDWTVRNSQKLNISKDRVENWKDLNGLSAYDFVYREITRTITRLNDAGYGVYVVGHVCNTVTQLEEGKNKVHYKLTITDNFWSRLHHAFHYVGAIAKVRKQTATKKQIPHPQDPTKTIEKIVKEDRIEFHLGLTSTDFDGIVKSKVRLPPTIVLPEDDAFSYFEKVYNEAVANS